MCGIWGAVSRKGTALTFQELKVLNNAMAAGTVRGYDGTGYVYKTHHKGKQEENIWFHKDATTGGEMEKISSTHAEGGIEWAFGHNRAATVGAVNSAGAHPFDAPHVIGIHNGTLTGGWRQRLRAKKKVVVDSEALMRSISHRGIDETLPEAKGAMAIVYYNKRTSRLHMFRNSERPVYWCKSTSGTLYWASEGKMLDWLLERNKQTISGEIESLEADVLYDITDAELKEVDIFEDTGTPVTQNRTTNYRGNWSKVVNGSTTTYTQQSGQETTTPKGAEIIHLPAPKSNPDYELCTSCERLLQNEPALFEMGYSTYKYYMCDDPKCVEQLMQDHSASCVWAPTTFYNRKGRKPNTNLALFTDLKVKLI